jgi:hypothetical protein
LLLGCAATARLHEAIKKNTIDIAHLVMAAIVSQMLKLFDTVCIVALNAAHCSLIQQLRCRQSLQWNRIEVSKHVNQFTDLPSIWQRSIYDRHERKASTCLGLSRKSTRLYEITTAYGPWCTLSGIPGRMS